MAQEYESSGRRTQGRRHTPSRLEQSGGRRTQHPAGERNSSSGSRTPRRSKKRRSSFGPLLYVIFVIGISALLAAVGWITANDLLALNKPEHSAVITLEEGDTVGEVADLLEENGLIEYKWLFRLFAAVTGGDDEVTMGTYTLNTDMDYRALLNGMSANSATKATVSVTIPEGMTTQQIFALLEEKGVASVEDLEQEAAEHDYAFDFLQDIPLGEVNRLEGFLYPDTYEFYTPHSPLYAINRMLVRFDELYDEDLRQKVADSGYTLREILTIASLIERETDGSDQTDIASVIYNRLNNPQAETAGYLNIDATLVYINGGREPTADDRNIDSPYNTYLYKGLPPGPIANPGMESITAALNPADTDYFYYALGDDGTHSFFQTYDQLQNFLASQERYQ